MFIKSRNKSLIYIVSLSFLSGKIRVLFVHIFGLLFFAFFGLRRVFGVFAPLLLLAPLLFLPALFEVLLVEDGNPRGLGAHHVQSEVQVDGLNFHLTNTSVHQAFLGHDEHLREILFGRL